MYFHMTLSFLGQLLDEISILWLLAGGYGIWMPRCYFPTFLRENRWSGGRSSGDPVTTPLDSWVPSLSPLVVLEIPPLTTPGLLLTLPDLTGFPGSPSLRIVLGTPRIPPQIAWDLL